MSIQQTELMVSCRHSCGLLGSWTALRRLARTERRLGGLETHEVVSVSGVPKTFSLYAQRDGIGTSAEALFLISSELACSHDSRFPSHVLHIGNPSAADAPNFRSTLSVSAMIWPRAWAVCCTAAKAIHQRRPHDLSLGIHSGRWAGGGRCHACVAAQARTFPSRNDAVVVVCPRPRRIALRCMRQRRGRPANVSPSECSLLRRIPDNHHIPMTWITRSSFSASTSFATTAERPSTSF